MFGVGCADWEELAEGDFVCAVYGSVVREAVFAAHEFAAEGVSVGVRAFAADGFSSHVGEVHVGVEVAVGLEEACETTFAPGEGFFGDGEGVIGIPCEAPAVGVFDIAHGECAEGEVHVSAAVEVDGQQFAHHATPRALVWRA